MKNAVGFGKPSVRNFFVYIIWLKIETAIDAFMLS